MPVKQVFLIRHGETAWSLSGQHASITDVEICQFDFCFCNPNLVCIAPSN